MATSIDQKNFVKTALRLPPELHAAVHEAAQKSGRSYNAELVERVQKTFEMDAANLKQQLSDLEGQLVRQRLETIQQKVKANGYVLTLMSLAERLPPEAFSDEPHLEEALKNARENQHQIKLEIIRSMQVDGQTLLQDFEDSIASGRVKVVSEEEKEALRAKRLSEPKEPPKKPRKSSP